MAKNTTKAKTEPAVEEDQGMTTPQSAAADSSPDKGSLDTASEGSTTPATEEEQGNVASVPTTENPDVTNGPSGTPAPTQDKGGAAVDAPSSTADAVPLPPEGKAFSGTHVVNTARGLNLRQRPSFGAAVLEVLPFGTAVQDIDPAGAPAGWLHVMTEDGKAGFVAARYVSPIKE